MRFFARLFKSTKSKSSNYVRSVPPRWHDFRQETIGWGHNVYGPESVNAAGEREVKLTVHGGTNIEVGDYLLMGTGPGGYWLVTVVEGPANFSDLKFVTAIREDPPA